MWDLYRRMRLVWARRCRTMGTVVVVRDDIEQAS